MHLTILEATSDTLRAGYECPCGCHPDVTYLAGQEAALDVCCCGNEFAVGALGGTSLVERSPFRREAHAFAAPWGAPLEAVWLVGASTHHADEPHHDHGAPSRGLPMAGSMPEPGRGPVDDTVSDPVCGMAVDPETARAKGLTSHYNGVDYFFCSRGCKLDFEEEPERYLDPSYTPSM